jgi:hypothetical protein
MKENNKNSIHVKKNKIYYDQNLIRSGVMYMTIGYHIIKTPSCVFHDKLCRAINHFP